MPSDATMLKPQVIQRATGVPRNGYRQDIQGLRAFAVTAVIFDHLLAWPSGGFVGVDIFFVISGFLITGHLMREWEKSGRISFLNFYKGRVKRILPAATAALVVTVAASFFLLSKTRATSVFWDGIWSTLFIGNWRFGAGGTDYFQADGPVSPLQHFWSLGVEEQFYFVWPWVMLLALWLMTRLKSKAVRPRVAMSILMTVLIAASFAWAMFETVASPGMAYFSTLSRAWELGIGALLALAAPLLVMIGDWIRPIIAWIGLAGMVIAVFVINSSQAFPAPTALLPVLATATVIAAGTGGDQKFLFPLTNPVSGYVGNISFSLYLWHFPVIILGRALWPNGGATFYAVCILATVALSVFAYNVIEDPIRKSNWLNAGANRPTPRSTITENRKKIQKSWLAFVAIVSVSCLAWVYLDVPSKMASADPTSTQESSTRHAEKYAKLSPAVAGLQREIDTALSAESWPELSPNEEHLNVATWLEEIQSETCEIADQSHSDDCYFAVEGADKTAVILGDSHAMAWSPGMRNALAESGYNIQMLFKPQCPAADVVVTKSDGAPYPECSAHRESAIDKINATKPDLVFLAQTWRTTFRLASEAEGDSARSEVADGLASTIKAITPSTGKIVTMSSPPTGGNLQECRTPVSKPSDCTKTVSPDWTSLAKAEKKATKDAGAVYVNTRNWFCSLDGICPAFIDDVAVRVDTHHLTIQYSSKLKDVIKSDVLDKL